jgi:hypothetical protein
MSDTPHRKEADELLEAFQEKVHPKLTVLLYVVDGRVCVGSNAPQEVVRDFLTEMVRMMNAKLSVCEPNENTNPSEN